MLDKAKSSLDDLNNGEKSETKEAQDSVNAGGNKAKQHKKPKIDLERIRAKADQRIDLGVTTEYTVIPIRNPKPDEFFKRYTKAPRKRTSLSFDPRRLSS